MRVYTARFLPIQKTDTKSLFIHFVQNMLEGTAKCILENGHYLNTIDVDGSQSTVKKKKINTKIRNCP